MMLFKKVTVSVSLLAILISTAFAQVSKDGLRALEVEQFEKAKAIFNAAINANTAVAESYFYLGQAYLGSSNEDSASIAFNKGAGADPAVALNYVGLGQIALLKGENQTATTNFDKAETMTASKDLKVLLALADACTHSPDKNNLDLALFYLAKAKKLEPKNYDVATATGDVYLEMAKGTEAIKNYDDALAIDSNKAKAHVRVGMVYKRAQNYEVSEANFKKALVKDPGYSPAYREISELYYSWRKFDKAIANYKQYVSMTDLSINTRVRYASFLFLAKDYKAAAEQINELLKIDSTNTNVYRLLGYSAYENGNYAKGLISMNTFFSRMEPRKILASDYAYLAKLQSKTGSDSLAIINMNKAIEMDKNNADFYSDLGNIYYQAHKYDESAVAFEGKIGLNRATTVDYFSYGRALYFAASKDPVKIDTTILRKADAPFAKLNSIQPNFPTAYLYRGRIALYLEPTNLEPAKNFYGKFVELASVDTKKNKKDLIESYRFFGDFYFRQNDTETTKSYFNKILELDPEDKQAQDALKGLK